MLSLYMTWCQLPNLSLTMKFSMSITLLEDSDVSASDPGSCHRITKKCYMVWCLEMRYCELIIHRYLYKFKRHDTKIICGNSWSKFSNFLSIFIFKSFCWSTDTNAITTPQKTNVSACGSQDNIHTAVSIPHESNDTSSPTSQDNPHSRSMNSPWVIKQRNFKFILDTNLCICPHHCCSPFTHTT